MQNTISILTENLVFLSSPLGNSFHFARIGIRMIALVRLFVSIKRRSMRSCAMIPVRQAVRSTAAIVQFVF